MSYSSSGAVATLWTPSYKMPVVSSGRYSSSSRLSSSSASERPFYSSTYSSSYSSRYTTPTRSSTVPSSYSRTSHDSHETTASRLLARERDRDLLKEDTYVPRSTTKSTTDTSSILDRYPSSYRTSKYLGSSSTSSTSSTLRKYGTTTSTPSPSRLSSSTTLSEVTTTTSEPANFLEPRLSVGELRRKFDSGVVLSIHNLNNPSVVGSTTSSSRAEVTNTNDDDDDGDDDDGEASSSTEDEVKAMVRGVSPSPGISLRFVSPGDVQDVSSSPKLGSSSKEKRGLNGLRNIGNTCFMNSVIQCLSNTKPLLEYLLHEDYSRDINTTISGMKGSLIKAFASLIKELWAPNTEDGIINTSNFKGQIQRFAPRFMGYSQQDAQEFLRYFLEGLHEDVNRVTAKPKPITTDIEDSLSDNQKANEAWKRYLRMDDSKVVDIFVGQLKSTLQCTVCGHCSVTFDPFWDLSLPVPSRTGSLKLSACLDAFTKEEVLDGDEKPTCSRCQTRRKCTKTFSIQKFPKILVLHLKRFSPTERFRGKLSNTVEFPLSGLDLSAYAAAKSQASTYNLYAVSNHSGTTYSGHYTAYCKHPYSTSWHEYNDSRVSSLSSRSIVSGEAYVLFYELTSSQSSHL